MDITKSTFRSDHGCPKLEGLIRLKKNFRSDPLCAVTLRSETPPKKIGPYDPTNIRNYFVDPTKKKFSVRSPPKKIGPHDPTKNGPQKLIHTILQAKCQDGPKSHQELVNLKPCHLVIYSLLMVEDRMAQRATKNKSQDGPKSHQKQVTRWPKEPRYQKPWIEVVKIDKKKCQLRISVNLGLDKTTWCP